MAGMLEVWVAEVGSACRVDDDKWRIDVRDAHDMAYVWAGQNYENLAAPHGHWAGAIPPGVYVVQGRAQEPKKEGPTETDHAIVHVPCDGSVCVHLYVRTPERGAKGERPESKPNLPTRKSPQKKQPDVPR